MSAWYNLLVMLRQTEMQWAVSLIKAFPSLRCCLENNPAAVEARGIHAFSVAAGEAARRRTWDHEHRSRYLGQIKRVAAAWGRAFGVDTVIPKVHWEFHLADQQVPELGAPINISMEFFEKANQHLIGESYRESSRKGGLEALAVHHLKWYRMYVVGIASVAEGNELSALTDSDSDSDGDPVARPRRTTRVELAPDLLSAVRTLEGTLGRDLAVLDGGPHAAVAREL
eukprot:gene5498-10288_t